eukprot:664870-Prorocentrum_minimum.AAC.1
MGEVEAVHAHLRAPRERQPERKVPPRGQRAHVAGHKPRELGVEGDDSRRRVLPPELQVQLKAHLRERGGRSANRGVKQGTGGSQRGGQTGDASDPIETNGSIRSIQKVQPLPSLSDIGGALPGSASASPRSRRARGEPACTVLSSYC